jgi:hypothetical protein
VVQQIRYQVFVSSTYEDLRTERQQATQAILEAGHFPSGMELFPASDQAQWDLIKRVIEESDYYVIILAGRYGSVSEDGISFTEMEYDYAATIGVPILGFVRDNVGNIPSSLVEKSEQGRVKLEAFRKKVMARHCRKYSAASDLGMLVMKSLISEARLRPRVGWIRADQAKSEEDIARERELSDGLKKALKRNSKLERALRDRQSLVGEIDRADLEQGDDLFDFHITFTDADKILTSDIVSISWDNIFKIIGPSMYGYILAKYNDRTSNTSTYSFEANIIDFIRGKIINRVQNRRISIHAGQIDQVVLQLKELGLIMYAESAEDNESFRGITLTELGERRLARISVKGRSRKQPVDVTALAG